MSQCNYLTFVEKNIDPMRHRVLEKIVKQVLEVNEGYEVLFELFSQVQQWLADNNTAQVRSVHDQLARDQERDQLEEEPAPEESIHLSDSDSDDLADNEDDESDPPPLQAKDLVADDLRATDAQFAGWTQQFKKEMISKGKSVDFR